MICCSREAVTHFTWEEGMGDWGLWGMLHWASPWWTHGGTPAGFQQHPLPGVCSACIAVILLYFMEEKALSYVFLAPHSMQQFMYSDGDEKDNLKTVVMNRNRAEEFSLICRDLDSHVLYSDPSEWQFGAEWTKQMLCNALIIFLVGGKCVSTLASVLFPHPG